VGRGSSQARCGARERELAASSRSIVAVSRGILEDDVSRGILGRFSVVGGWRGAHQDARCFAGYQERMNGRVQIPFDLYY